MYVDRFIQNAEGVDRERICLAARPHWYRVIERGAGGLLLLMIGIALILFGEPLRRLLMRLLPFTQVPTYSSGDTQYKPLTPIPSSDAQVILERVFAWSGIVLALVGALLLGWALLDRHFTEYAITIAPGFGGRIIKVHGVLSRQTVAVPLVMVNNLALYEPLLGRLLGWGHIDIETGNDYDGDRLEHIANPHGFYQVWKMLLDYGYRRDRRASLVDPYGDGPGW